MSARALYRAAMLPGAKPPYDRVAIKIYYPAAYGDTPVERNTGLIPANSDQAPFPVLILMHGINLPSESYSWLARRLADAGIATVTYVLVDEEMPGYVSLTPGLDISALAPDVYGSRPSATAIAPIIDALRDVNAEGVLAGKLDLDRIVLGGHSAGGTVAMLNARPDWFPGVVGALSYGAHSGAATALGYPEDSLMPLPGQVPTLIAGGTRDGCIANSSSRYGNGQQASATARVERTFDEALERQQGDSYLVLVEGANHFSLAFPADPSTGRPFIDHATTAPDEDIRDLLAQVCELFVQAAAGSSAAGESLQALLAEHPLVFASRQR